MRRGCELREFADKRTGFGVCDPRRRLAPYAKRQRDRAARHGQCQHLTGRMRWLQPGDGLVERGGRRRKQLLAVVS